MNTPITSTTDRVTITHEELHAACRSFDTTVRRWLAVPTAHAEDRITDAQLTIDRAMVANRRTLTERRRVSKPQPRKHNARRRPPRFQRMG